ncbi:hypothetical protein [Marinomonas atlantica]|uniref:hypothetical protein n=1 Tax=Marinomonas atlantica TaxID=1806668 RepID=UPI00082FCE90|nr:hypothetical protein [Marinomonas atlantica]
MQTKTPKNDEHFYTFKSVEDDDVDKLLELEEIVWKEQGCSREMITSRIQTFQEGQIIAVTPTGEVVGYIGTQFVNDLSDSCHTWNQITDFGTIKNSHVKSGNYMFGISLTAHPQHPGVGMQLQLKAGVIGVKHRKHGCFLGSRVPKFHMGSADYSIEEWVHGKNDRSRDREVRYYQRAGFNIVKVIPDYFPDPESLNYGALMFNTNPFRFLPFPTIWANLIHRYGHRLFK